MRIVSSLLTVLIALSIAGTSAASVITYQFSIDGLQEVPPVDTPGHGTATVTIDTDTRELTWDVEYSDLIGNSTAAHFHGPADFGENAGVQVGMPGDFGGTSGTLVGSATITETQLQQLLDGLWYVNIHSTFRPGGEIRGQVVGEVPNIPTVSEWGLIILALLLLTAGTLVIRQYQLKTAAAPA